ncbi:glucose N-acetyltransferase [Lasiosphaeria miniovina]|uniref:Glucose N-acetyltransferase n=1 Tax=Lasiosphaeria miniovina TaxID=1954250 RepID=A0AA40BET2_9PEZI|nr:glucose N-acetyltransferase [Lasiosphaeria miniovina]KAK0732930.1 glucose N-acetyltransferase [Lasiosphaeria miniovina]
MSYSPLPNGSSGQEAASPSTLSLNSPSGSPKSHPSVTEILCSRRVRLRLIAPIVITLSIVLFVLHYDAVVSAPAVWGYGHNDTTSPATHDQLQLDNVDWSRFAYTQYVTNSDYLCNSIMLFELLHKLGSRADRVIMYPSQMFDPAAPDDGSGRGNDARLLIKARDEYKVHLVPIEVQRRSTADATWAESFTKLLAFNQTQYDRVLSLDSDSVVLQPMDELFLLPDCAMAMPRAYWLYPDKEILSSQLMLVRPSAAEFARVMARAEAGGGDDYDMEIVNYLYRDSALVLPHRPYDMLTSEFRAETHAFYLGTDDPAAWDPVAAFNEAKFLHFSDWPVPKPWIRMSDSVRESMQPPCRGNGAEKCVEREMWLGFYSDFANRRAVRVSPVATLWNPIP